MVVKELWAREACVKCSWEDTRGFYIGIWGGLRVVNKSWDGRVWPLVVHKAQELESQLLFPSNIEAFSLEHCRMVRKLSPLREGDVLVLENTERRETSPGLVLPILCRIFQPSL